jgi:SAM-dependent methyltransferase
MKTAKDFVLAPMRALLGPERYESLRYWAYRFCFSDQGYSTSYYEGIEAANAQVYKLLAATLVEIFSPVSVADVGCGSGGISLALRAKGVERIYPFDFSQASVDMTKSKGFPNAQRLDLTQASEITATADLCLCLEVAEHIPRKYERHLVSLLSQVAPESRFCCGAADAGDVRWKDDSRLQHESHRAETLFVEPAWPAQLTLTTDYTELTAETRRHGPHGECFSEGLLRFPVQDARQDRVASRRARPIYQRATRRSTCG